MGARMTENQLINNPLLSGSDLLTHSTTQEVLLFNLSTSSPPPHRQHLIASPSSSSTSAASPPLHPLLHGHGHHHQHHQHHHLSLSAHDIGADTKRHGSAYSSRNSSPRPGSASPSQQHADDGADCLMSAALSIVRHSADVRGGAHTLDAVEPTTKRAAHALCYRTPLPDRSQRSAVSRHRWH